MEENSDALAWLQSLSDEEFFCLLEERFDRVEALRGMIFNKYALTEGAKK